MTHPQPPYSGTERETLVGYLDNYRAIMIDKASGLTSDEVNTALEPSSLTLINMVYHLALVEHSWFYVLFSGNDWQEPWASVDWDADPDWEFDSASELDPELILVCYREAIDVSNSIIAAADSMERLSARDRDGEKRSLRWILVHMIEEVARHAGHADLIRESIDGQVGDFGLT